jgi:hypothetical protein
VSFADVGFSSALATPSMSSRPVALKINEFKEAVELRGVGDWAGDERHSDFSAGYSRESAFRQAFALCKSPQLFRAEQCGPSYFNIDKDIGVRAWPGESAPLLAAAGTKAAFAAPGAEAAFAAAAAEAAFALASETAQHLVVARWSLHCRIS